MDIPQFLQRIAKNKDEIYHTIMGEVNAELNVNLNQDVFELIQMKFFQKQIPVNKYYGNVNNDDNNMIVQLKNQTTKALERDEEVV